ncbi:hypothetical protein ECB98_25345 [Brucellaceae bacterium VT-16-1752]|nr:hypothetical protein ECB98_25345 [Brucellaceae bacterium VT-16-1752]
MGKAILAHNVRFENVVAAMPLVPVTSHTITDPVLLKKVAAPAVIELLSVSGLRSLAVWYASLPSAKSDTKKEASRSVAHQSTTMSLVKRLRAS